MSPLSRTCLGLQLVAMLASALNVVVDGQDKERKGELAQRRESRKPTSNGGGD